MEQSIHIDNSLGCSACQCSPPASLFLSLFPSPSLSAIEAVFLTLIRLVSPTPMTTPKRWHLYVSIILAAHTSQTHQIATESRAGTTHTHTQTRMRTRANCIDGVWNGRGELALGMGMGLGTVWGIESLPWLADWLTVWQTLMLMNIKWILLWHQKGPPAGLSWARLLAALRQPCGSESDIDRDRNSDSNCDSDSKRRRESGDGGESHRKDFAVAIGTGPSRRTYLAHKMLRLKNAKVEICVRRGRLIASDSVGLHRELCGQGKCIKN